MTTARSIIEGALTFGLNKLYPGEVLDADLGARCLEALNMLADEMNGGKSFLFREILTASSAITGTFGTIGTDWAGLVAGDEILGATVQYNPTLDIPLKHMTMGQYANVALKTMSTGFPVYYAPDGQAKVFLYGVANANIITLRTKQVVSDFADLDTDYTMPKGYKSALSDMLAEKIAPTAVGGISASVAAAARKARNQLYAQAVNPAILGGDDIGLGPVARIRRGF